MVEDASQSVTVDENQSGWCRRNAATTRSIRAAGQYVHRTDLRAGVSHPGMQASRDGNAHGHGHVHAHLYAYPTDNSVPTPKSYPSRRITPGNAGRAGDERLSGREFTLEGRA